CSRSFLRPAAVRGPEPGSLRRLLDDLARINLTDFVGGHALGLGARLVDGTAFGIDPVYDSLGGGAGGAVLDHHIAVEAFADDALRAQAVELRVVGADRCRRGE